MQKITKKELREKWWHRFGIATCSILSVISCGGGVSMIVASYKYSAPVGELLIECLVFFIGIPAVLFGLYRLLLWVIFGKIPR